MAESKLFNLLMDRARDNMAKPYSTISKFHNGLKDMKEADTKNGDKYFHSKVNCEAGQYGDIGTANVLNIGKEIFDILDKNALRPNGLSFKENIDDSMNDFDVDYTGLFRGLTNPLGNCKELINDFRPNGLNSKY